MSPVLQRLLIVYFDLTCFCGAVFNFSVTTAAVVQQTCFAPALSRVLRHSLSVAPVVLISSQSKTVLPLITLTSLTLNAPLRFSARSFALSLCWSLVLRVLSRASLHSTPSSLEQDFASRADWLKPRCLRRLPVCGTQVTRSNSTSAKLSLTLCTISGAKKPAIVFSPPNLKRCTAETILPE